MGEFHRSLRMIGPGGGLPDSTTFDPPFTALRVWAGVSGSGFCGGLVVAGFLSGGRQGWEPVVGQVLEASC